jgi:hypothetical protein
MALNGAPRYRGEDARGRRLDQAANIEDREASWIAMDHGSPAENFSHGTPIPISCPMT